MFDDHTPQGGGAVPPNLPIGEPEDIFAGVDTTPDSPIEEAPAPAVMDAPATPPAKTALSAGILKPKDNAAPAPELFALREPAPVPTAAPSTPAPAAAPAPAPVAPAPVPAPAPLPGAPMQPLPSHTLPSDAPEMYAVKEPRASKGIITAIVIVIVVLVLGGGGVFVYNQFVAGSSTAEVPANLDASLEGDTTSSDTEFFDDLDTTDADSVDTIDTTADINVPVSTDESDILFGEPVDTDADGLDDEREADLGTDESHWDTDGDELSDGDEVIIWKTDPLNPDSDGDGFKDGAEIKNGYSPTGPGKIFEPPTEPPTTSTP